MSTARSPAQAKAKPKQSIRHWIEKDALKSLKQSLVVEGEENATSTKEIGPRKAIVVGFGTGWTLAGINLTFGRYTNNPYPSLTISDGKHEVKAYLAGDQPQSSAFWSRPTLEVGSLIRMETVEFVEESTVLETTTTTTTTTEEPATDAAAKPNASTGSAKSSPTFVLAISGVVQNLTRKPVLDLSKSSKYSREVEQWVIRKTGGAAPPQQAQAEAQIASGSEKEDEHDTEEEGGKDSSSDSSTESDASSSDEKTQGVARIQQEPKPASSKKPKAGVARRKHKRKLINPTGEPTAPRRATKKPKEVGEEGRGARPAKLSWDDKYAHLKAYKAEFDHCNAPVGHKQGEFSLGSWINQLRMGKGSLSEDQKQELDGLGFVWDMAEYNWQRNFDSLIEYKRENGHTCVPISFKDDAGNLGTWVYNQRRAKRADKLLPERKKKLNQINFEWDVRRGKRSA